jgi:hypothetical protein
MREAIMVQHLRGQARPCLTALLCLMVTLATGHCSAAQPAKQKGGGQATVQSAPGALLRRGDDGKSWQPIKAKDSVANEVVVVALPEAEIVSANKAVELKMLADVGHRLRLPVLESAVIIHDNAAVDLDFTLDRGIVTLTNLRDKGKATVRLRFRDQNWEISLKEPGTKLAVEMYGRYPPGLPVPVDKDAKVVRFKNEPTNDLLFLVLKGEVFVDTGIRGLPLKEPPGKAFVHWDSVVGLCEVKEMDKLPEELTKPRTDEEKKTLAIISADAKQLEKGTLKEGLTRLIQSDELHGRRVAVVVSGALDELSLLIRALASPKHADARDQAVLVLRNWLGRSPGQAEKLFATLTDEGKYNRIEAGTLLFLLFGPDEKQLALPAAYDVLIAMLGHDKIAIRELARWHLYRLVPSGKDIPYDAAGPAEARQQSQARWRQLIPVGQLPPKTTTDKK